MKNRKAIIAIVLAVGVLAAVPFAYGGPGVRRGHPGGPAMHGFGDGFGAGMLFGHLRHVKEELELSDAQVQQIQAIFATVREENEQYREQLHGGMHSALTTLLANPNDLAAAQAALDRQTAAERALKQNLLTATSKALNVLTPAQRTELGEMIAKHAERRAERRGNRRQNRR